MDAGNLRGVATALALLAFVGVVVWAYGRRQQSVFKAAALLPLEEDDKPSGEQP
jgi:cytochrome c oxidase cbb3-type subunit IV